ncbi:MAG: methyltransferase domain-containing protein [Candidatus Dormibacteraeota bacterium]|nr:methyltransferase domain-containing protein [Candidatus Dormibacteraeota bacterium]MBO0745783.1 methyltransferase domain-containing protein [Candidatus Dormibacteraeota bacterium]
MPDATALREDLVRRLRNSGVVHDTAVVEALRVVPREVFLPGLDLDEAYRDIAVPTHRDQTGEVVSSCSQPSMVALMLEQLSARPGQRVLEIGAGTGYNAALLKHLVGPGGRVVSIDVDPEICVEARARTQAAGAEVEVEIGDGALGWPAAAPYDRIEVTAAAGDLPTAWWDQLGETGRLVVPLHLGPRAEASVAWERAGTALRALSRLPCGFLALRGEPPSAPRREPPLGPLLFGRHALQAFRGEPLQLPPGTVVVRRPVTTFAFLPEKAQEW